MANSGTEPLIFAVPKGRLLKLVAQRLARAGVPVEMFDESDRRLVRETRQPFPLRALLLKPDDVPTYVEYGAAHVGVVGRDVLLERGSEVFVPLDLELGRCRMVVAAPVGSMPDAVARRSRTLRVATKYPRIAAAHFAGRGDEVDVIYLGGSVEIAPQVGLADWIVDLVETGETLQKNGLEVREIICEVSAVVIANRVAFKLRHSAMSELLRALA